MREAALQKVLLGVFMLAVGASALARAEGALPSVLARYEIRHGHGAIERMDVLRTDTRIEYRLPDRQVTEVWELNLHGELSHLVVFPNEGRVVHYTAGDLRTVHIEPDWTELGSLVSAAARSNFRRRGVTRVAGETAQRLVGSLHGAPATLLWVENVGLPARLDVGRGREARTLKLVSLKRCSGGACAAVDTSDYREIEFADLGDSEHDPFVRGFMAAVGVGHPR